MRLSRCPANPPGPAHRMHPRQPIDGLSPPTRGSQWATMLSNAAVGSIPVSGGFRVRLNRCPSGDHGRWPLRRLARCPVRCLHYPRRYYRKPYGTVAILCSWSSSLPSGVSNASRLPREALSSQHLRPHEANEPCLRQSVGSREPKAWVPRRWIQQPHGLQAHDGPNYW